MLVYRHYYLRVIQCALGAFPTVCQSTYADACAAISHGSIEHAPTILLGVYILQLLPIEWPINRGAAEFPHSPDLFHSPISLYISFIGSISGFVSIPAF